MAECAKCALIFIWIDNLVDTRRSASNQSQDREDAQQNVLDQLPFPPAQIVGPQVDGLHKAGHKDAQQRKEYRADQTDEGFQVGNAGSNAAADKDNACAQQNLHHVVLVGIELVANLAPQHLVGSVNANRSVYAIYGRFICFYSHIELQAVGEENGDCH